MKTVKKSIVVAVRLTPEQSEWLDVFAATLGKSRSGVFTVQLNSAIASAEFCHSRDLNGVPMDGVPRVSGDALTDYKAFCHIGEEVAINADE